MIAPGVDAPQEDTQVFKWKPATDYLKLTDVKMVDVEPNALGDASEQTPIGTVFLGEVCRTCLTFSRHRDSHFSRAAR